MSNGDKTLLYDDYAELTRKYKALYGEDTVVLIEVGSFLEFYDCDQGLGADVPRVCGIMGVQMTRKNKSIAQVSRQNPSFGGIPRVAAPKYVQMLIDADMTVVLCMQVTPPPNPRREVTEVLSRSTCMASAILSAGSNVAADQEAPLMAVHLDGGPGWSTVGWALVHLATGHVRVGETHSQTDDLLRPLDAVRREVASFRPSEVVLTSTNSVDSIDAFCEHVGLPRRRVRGRERDADASNKNKLSTSTHETAVLTKVFPDTGFLTVAEYLDLERKPVALTALVSALQFAYEHNETIVERIGRPEVVDDDDGSTLDLGPDTLRQLDVIGPGSSLGLVSLLSARCRTAPGRRAFKERLMSPLSWRRRRDLEARYDAVDAMARLPTPTQTELVRALDRVGDLERVYRRLGLLKKNSTIADLRALASSVAAAIEVLELVEGAVHPLMPPDARRGLSNVLSTIEATADLAQTDDVWVFKPGFSRVLDDARDELRAAKAIFYTVASALNASIGADHVRVEGDDGGSGGSGGPYLAITARRWKTAVDSGAVGRTVVDEFRGADARLVENGGSAHAWRVEHPCVGASAAARVTRAQTSLALELSACLRRLVDQITDASTCDVMRRAVKDLVDVDVALACSRNAAEMGHVRPTLSRDEAETEDAVVPNGHFKAKGLRHPIIESVLLDRGEPFVPNDVSLGGRTECGGMNGLLLYGVNAVGKSSVMKAVGLAVVMAQAGMFVAANTLELTPFSGLYSRIGLRDDLARGHSTFVVEMLDLRAILSRSGPGSLVLGDELCAGTEAPSALSIVGAGVVRLVQKRTAFVFATHLHELVKVPAVAELMEASKVKAMHLSVHRDERTGRLILDRRLSPGTGPPTYGLEVCRSLDMDAAFLKTADAIRRHVLGIPDRIVPDRPSRYNKKVVVDRCGVCGDPADETHHIVPQKDHDKGSQKHRRHNLVPLCEACHLAHHMGRVNIDGYKMTSDGLKLQTGGKGTSLENPWDSFRCAS